MTKTMTPPAYFMPLVALAVVVTLSLAACGESGLGTGTTPPPGGSDQLDPLDPTLAYLTEVEAAERLRVLKNDAVSIGNGLIDGSVWAATQGVPTEPSAPGDPMLEPEWAPVPYLNLRDEAGTTSLATGTFTFDEDSWTWRYGAAPADALIVSWRSLSTDAAAMELSVTWAPVTSVTNHPSIDNGSVVQVPTGWRVRVLRNGVAIVDLDASFAFRTCNGVRMAEPTRLTFSGFLGDGAARVDVHELTLEAVGEEAFELRADVDVRSGSLQLGVAAAISASAELERDSGCWPTQLDALSMTGSLQVTGPGPLTLIRGDISAVANDTVGGYDVTLRNGRFVSGDKRVDIDATINADAVDPGTRVFLTFAGGVVQNLVDFVEGSGLLD